LIGLSVTVRTCSITVLAAHGVACGRSEHEQPFVADDDRQRIRIALGR